VSTFPHCSEQCPHKTTANQGATIPAYVRNAPNKMWKKKKKSGKNKK
jgi:phage terminase large subunit GpA-like protein